MSIPLMALVWTSTMKDATEVEVLSRLASHANDEGESCFAGIPRIAKLVRRSERTVQRTIDSLEGAGWLSVVRGGGAGNLTQYLINVEKLKGCQDVTLLSKPKRVTSAQKRVTLTPKKGDIDAAPPIEGNVVKQKQNKTTPPSPSPARGPLAFPVADSADAMTSAVEQACVALGAVRRREVRRVTEQIAAAVARGEPPHAAAAALIAERTGTAADRLAAREREEALQERRSYAMWAGMSPEYRRLNPWRGKIPERETA